MCASSIVSPRTRVSPCSTPDFSYRYTVPNSKSRIGSSRYDRCRDLYTKMWNGQFIGFK